MVYYQNTVGNTSKQFQLFSSCVEDFCLALALLGSVCKKSTQEKWNPSTRRRSFPYKNKVCSVEKKNLYMTKCSVRSTSIFLGRFERQGKCPPQKIELSISEELREKGRSGHIWIRVLQGIIFVFIANLGQISRLQMPQRSQALRYTAYPSCFKKSSS